MSADGAATLGSIDKFLGDGIIATFGVAQSSPAYAVDATLALDEALAENRSLERGPTHGRPRSSRG
jgi:class 3 adenylate cyclase